MGFPARDPLLECLFFDIAQSTIPVDEQAFSSGLPRYPESTNNQRAVFDERGQIMNSSARLFTGLFVAAFMLAGASANQAMAQEKAGKASLKVLLDNARVRVVETTFKPGDELAAITTSVPRVIRVLKGGTLLWTYADGKKEPKAWKTGDVMWVEPGPAYSSKNTGKTEVQLFVINLK
jgi:quercetin dioxygenase-like cupin family protein